MWVIFLSFWPDEPVFHEHGDVRRTSKGWTDFTKCGREVGAHKPFFPRKHAVKFGRPCKSCEAAAE